MPQGSVWENEYQNPQLITKDDEPQKDILRFFRFLKKEEGVELENLAVLDLGSGTGRNANYLAKLGNKVIGLEISPTAINLAKSRAKSIKIEVNYQLHDIGSEYPFNNETFDLVLDVTSSNSLNGKERDIYLSEVLRVLKKDGILVIRTPILYNGFYDDFTHVKPYHPKALLHYLTTYEKSEQTTLTPIKGKFKVLKLKYRKAPLFLGILDTPLFFIFPLFNLLYRFGISSLKKTGYMIILKKIE